MTTAALVVSFIFPRVCRNNFERNSRWKCPWGSVLSMTQIVCIFMPPHHTWARRSASRSLGAMHCHFAAQHHGTPIQHRYRYWRARFQRPSHLQVTTATGYLIINVHNNVSSMLKNVGGFGGVLSVPVPVSPPGALGSPLPCRYTDALRHFQLAKMWKQDTTRPSCGTTV